MAAEYISIHKVTPEERKIKRVVNVLNNNGVVIYPTDSIYGMGCSIYSQKAIARLCKLKGIKPSKHQFSFICKDLSEVSTYVKRISTPVFKVLKRTLPGPYTYILEASTAVPKILHINKKTVGIRIPDNKIPLAIVNFLGHPLLNTSVFDDDETIEHSTNPELIFLKYSNQIDMLVDGGVSPHTTTTVVDCSKNVFEVIREGLGDIYQHI